MPNVNAAALKDVLAGESGPYRDIVLFNTAAALIVAAAAANLADGMALARQTIDTGKAQAALEALVRVTNGTTEVAR